MITAHKVLHLNRHVALHTTQILLMCFGVVLSVAFLATLQWWLALAGIGVGAFAWILLYRIEVGVRTILGARGPAAHRGPEAVPGAIASDHSG